jgi:hypothetical protein
MRFTADEIELVRAMAARGLPAVVIAAAVGRKPGGIRSLCAHRGIRLRAPRSNAEVRFGVEQSMWTDLKNQAARLGFLSVAGLARAIVCIAVRDHLINSILDMEQAASRQRVLCVSKPFPRAGQSEKRCTVLHHVPSQV